MATLSTIRELHAVQRHDEISAYCQELFAMFARSDQRRWGEVYLRGLLRAPGRKSPANITEQVIGRPAVQPIQQFVNQSTWECDHVRRYLAERISAAVKPLAWSFDEVVFPKNGTKSAGVARQFVPTAGRVMNCQLALASSLVHPLGSVPVNWHLMMPRHWDTDQELRSRAHVPDHERHRPRWRYVLESLDEMLGGWNVPVLPVLADWRGEQEVEPLLWGLEERGLGYLVEVSGSAPLPAAGMAGRAGPGSRPASAVAQDVSDRSERAVLAWRDAPGSRVRHSQFLAVQLPTAPGRSRTRALGAPVPWVRHLLVEWPFGRPKPRTYWLTNLPAAQLPETVALAEPRHQGSRGCQRLHQDYGLSDFEGRSFRGWHHHVTLASAALGFDVLRELQEYGERSRSAHAG